MPHVLIVEDEMWIRSALVEMVERIGEGFRVAGEAGNGEEAWVLIGELMPDLVITDIMMPQKDGLWLVRQIAEQQLPIESIIVSGYDNFHYAQQAMRYDVTEYLLKPVAEEELHKALLRTRNRLASNREFHEHMMRIQPFLERLQHAEAGLLLDEQDALVRAILRFGERQPAARLTLLRHLVSKLCELLSDAMPTPPVPPDIYDGPAARDAIRRLTEAWLQHRTAAAGQSKYAIRQACDYIDKHYMEELTLPQTAAMTHLSVSYFSALFKQQTGVSFVHYLNGIRIERVKRLLLEPDLKIYEAAELVGYTSLPHFNRVFKAFVGVSPNEYRRNLGI